MPDLGSTYMTMLWLSVILGLVHVAIAATAAVAKRGQAWGFGPRDETPAPLGRLGARLERAWKNFLETFPLFLGAVVVLGSTNGNVDLAGIGAMLYFWARLAYLPVYAIGIPFVRTLVWTVSLAGIVVILVACVPGVGA